MIFFFPFTNWKIFLDLKISLFMSNFAFFFSAIVRRISWFFLWCPNESFTTVCPPNDWQISCFTSSNFSNFVAIFLPPIDETRNYFISRSWLTNFNIFYLCHWLLSWDFPVMDWWILWFSMRATEFWDTFPWKLVNLQLFPYDRLTGDTHRFFSCD